MRPAARKYSVTTLEPGAREDLTQGRRVRPFSTAFFASRPAAIITLGLEVLVQEVMAAMTTAPSPKGKLWPSSRVTGPLFAAGAPSGLSCRPRSSSKALGTCGNATRSCGRRGPARLASTLERFSARLSVNTGSWPGSRHSPWALL
ncbi:hypothetical protein D3C85_1308680 [compost metagenome]